MEISFFWLCLLGALIIGVQSNNRKDKMPMESEEENFDPERGWAYNPVTHRMELVTNTGSGDNAQTQPNDCAEPSQAAPKKKIGRPIGSKNKRITGKAPMYYEVVLDPSAKDSLAMVQRTKKSTINAAPYQPYAKPPKIKKKMGRPFGSKTKVEPMDYKYELVNNKVVPLSGREETADNEQRPPIDNTRREGKEPMEEVPYKRPERFGSNNRGQFGFNNPITSGFNNPITSGFNNPIASGFNNPRPLGFNNYEPSGFNNHEPSRFNNPEPYAYFSRESSGSNSPVQSDPLIKRPPTKMQLGMTGHARMRGRPQPIRTEPQLDLNANPPADSGSSEDRFQLSLGTKKYRQKTNAKGWFRKE